MTIHQFSGGRIRRAEWDAATRQLDLHWQGGRVDAYQQVPEEVFRRLCAAPNAATYWEDRIAEEYPKARPRQGSGQPDAGQAFRDLFAGGGGDSSDGPKDLNP